MQWLWNFKVLKDKIDQVLIEGGFLMLAKSFVLAVVLGCACRSSESFFILVYEVWRFDIWSLFHNLIYSLAKIGSNNPV